MRKLTGIKTHTYDMGDGWRLEIIHRTKPGKNCNGIKEADFEAWIYLDSYSVKDFMFGTCVQPTCPDLNAFVEMAVNNFDNYIGIYIENFCDEEV